MSSVQKFQRSDHGRDPGTLFRARKGPSRKDTARKDIARKNQAKERQGIIFKFGPSSRAAPQECVGRS